MALRQTRLPKTRYEDSLELPLLQLVPRYRTAACIDDRCQDVFDPKAVYFTDGTFSGHPARVCIGK